MTRREALAEPPSRWLALDILDGRSLVVGQSEEVRSPWPSRMMSKRSESQISHRRMCFSITLLVSAAIHVAAHASARQQPARTPDMYFAPTRHSVADAMLKLARVTASDVVYDLGSGDGRILILAAQKYGARGVGIEIDPRLVEISRQVAREGQVTGKVTFIEGDLFAADLSEATVITLYLSASINRQLEPKLKQLRPGTRIVSHQFPIGHWEPDETVRAEDGTDVFLWTIPAVKP